MEEITLLKNKRPNTQLQIAPTLHGRSPKQKRPTAQKTSAAHQTASPGTTRANLRLARGAGATPRTPLTRGCGSPSTHLHLHRGPWPHGRVPAPLEGFGPSRKPPPHSRPPSARGAPPTPPTGALKSSDASRAPGSKANPHHTGLLAPPGNQIPALFDQPATIQPSSAMCGCCAGWLVSFHGTVPPTPALPPRRTPRNRTVAPSKSIRPPTRRPPRTTS
jgi:hypothetical protein